ncbi:MAG: PAS domain S-box protein [Methanospirillaceae archaeon]|nr:PAS domain S-box protein [Methanospirillaceae archaeon]
MQTLRQSCRNRRKEMQDNISPRTLNAVILRIIRFRLFIPLLLISLIALSAVGYWEIRMLEASQLQVAQAQSRIVDQYLEHAGRMLDNLGRVAESGSKEELARVMESTWAAYRYYDTFYYLDPHSRIVMITPPDPRYTGLDMSRMPYFRIETGTEPVMISRPFISLRTGDPTVYLIRHLGDGGAVVGELSLTSLENEVTRLAETPENGVLYILDQSGMLLAHPSPDLVREQTFFPDPGFMKQQDGSGSTLVYKDSGTTVLGSFAAVKKADWLVVNQIPLVTVIAPFLLGLILLFATFCIIWLVLVRDIQGQLESRLIRPLVLLSRGTSALSDGDFSHARDLAEIPETFAELDRLAGDFVQMSLALQARQEALEKSERRYRSLYDENPTLYFTLDKEGTILSVNRYGAEYLGYTVSELVGESVTNVFYPDDKPLARTHLQSCLARPEEIFQWELRKVRRDGSMLWVKETAHVISGEENNPIVLIVCEDITKRKQAEDEVTRTSEELHAAYEEMTANAQELKQNYEELHKSQDALRQARKKLTLLNHIAFTDIRSAIFTLSGYIQLEESYISDEKQRQYHDEMGTIAGKIEDTLNFAKTYQDLGIRPACWQNVEQVFLFGISHINVLDLKRHIMVKELEIYADPMLEQVFFNLAKNVKQHSKGATEITIRYENRDDSIIIFFEDNGEGIPEDEKETLFERKYEERKGAGLFLIREILGITNITMKETGKPGTGARFEILVPEGGWRFTRNRLDEE